MRRFVKYQLAGFTIWMVTCVGLTFMIRSLERSGAEARSQQDKDSQTIIEEVQQLSVIDEINSGRQDSRETAVQGRESSKTPRQHRSARRSILSQR